MDKNMTEFSATEFSASNSTCMSSDIRQLAHSFLLAKREFTKTGKSAENSHQRYAYAKIEDIYNAVEVALMNQNIIIWHYANVIRHEEDTTRDKFEVLCTRLIHTPTGQWIEDMRLLESEKPGNQGKGAANTYMKKYALLSLCAIATEDDDGQEEEKYIRERSHEATINQLQCATINEALKASSFAGTIYKNILSFNKISDLAELKAASFESVMSYIKNFKLKA